MSGVIIDVSPIVVLGFKNQPSKVNPSLAGIGRVSGSSFLLKDFIAPEGRDPPSKP